MKHNFLTLAILIAAAAVSAFGQTAAKDVAAVAKVDLQKYSGKWFEIAKYPNKFQKQCVGNTTASYTIKPKNKLEVLNQCLTKDGTTDSAKADGKIEDKATNAKLKVRFAPSFLSVFPFVWANYWVIDLDPEYKWAVVGEPKREYLWILSREPEMSDKLFQDILRRAETMGYNPGKVERTPQNVESVKGSVIAN